MENHAFWKAVRITTWGTRFIQNCRNKKSNRLTGPLSTTEIEKQVKWWIKRDQKIYSATEKFQEDKLRRNLQKNNTYREDCSRCTLVYSLWGSWSYDGLHQKNLLDPETEISNKKGGEAMLRM